MPHHITTPHMTTTHAASTPVDTSVLASTFRYRLRARRRTEHEQPNSRTRDGSIRTRDTSTPREAKTMGECTGEPPSLGRSTLLFAFKPRYVCLSLRLVAALAQIQILLAAALLLVHVCEELCTTMMHAQGVWRPGGMVQISQLPQQELDDTRSIE
jgi:hypothetical protein